MDEIQIEKKAKPLKGARTVSLQIRKETKRKIRGELVRVNRKELGKTIRIDDLIDLALGLVTPDHIAQLQEASLSNSDRFERDYRAYVAQFGPMDRDLYLGKRLNGEIGGEQRL